MKAGLRDLMGSDPHSLLALLQPEVENFLATIEDNAELGTLLIDDSALLEPVSWVLEGLGYCRSHSWLGLANCLALEHPTFVIIGKRLEVELLDVLEQLTRGNGRLTALGLDGSSRRFIQFNPRLAHVLLVVERKNLKVIESQLGRKLN